MVTSRWKVYTSTKKIAAAEKILHRIKKTVDRQLFGIRTEKYHKDDSIIYYYDIQHDLEYRPDLLYEVMIMADLLANSWELSGSILSGPEGYSSSSSISGVDTIQWFIVWDKS